MRDHGPEQSFIGVAHRVLIDTNVLVYRFDSRFPEQQEIANSLPRERLLDGTARIPHRAILEFVAATTRGGEKNRLLEPLDARREAEELMAQFPVIYPDQISRGQQFRGRPPINFGGSMHTFEPMRKPTV